MAPGWREGSPRWRATRRAGPGRGCLRAAPRAEGDGPQRPSSHVVQRERLQAATGMRIATPRRDLDAWKPQAVEGAAALRGKPPAREARQALLVARRGGKQPPIEPELRRRFAGELLGEQLVAARDGLPR